MKNKILIILVLLLSFSLARAQTVDDLLRATSNNDIARVQRLINAGMDPNTSDQHGNTLLIIAGAEGYFDLAKLLLTERARVRARNAVGDSALMLAALRGHLEMVRLLAAYGGELSPSGWTPLHYCAWEGQTDVCRLLIELGANVNARSENGTTPLMMAAQQGKTDVVRLLLQSKADTTARNEHEATALAWAIKYEQRDVATILRAAGVRE